MKPPPLIVVESSSEDVVADYHVVHDVMPDGSVGVSAPGSTGKILRTRWHDHSDDAMRAAMSALASSSPEIPADHPCYSIIRVLSSAVHNLTRARQELEESRRELMQKEAARRARARDLLQELKPSDKDVANRVMQSLFPNDDETTHQVHRVQRQESLMVRCHFRGLLYYSLMLAAVSHRVFDRSH